MDIESLATGSGDVTERPAPSDAVVGAWTALMRAQQRVLGHIEQALKAAGWPPLAWYDVLLELERGPADGLRLYELQERMLLTQPNASRLVDRMERAGLVEKRRAVGDGRGALVVATPAGRGTRARMWPDYAAAIDGTVGSVLSGAEATTLAALLRRLGRPADRDPAESPERSAYESDQAR